MNQNESRTKRASDELPNSPKRPRIENENAASLLNCDEKESEAIDTATVNLNFQAEISKNPETAQITISEDTIKPITPSKLESNSNQTNEDTTITSEQLLLALTSIPPDVKPSSSSEIALQPQETPLIEAPLVEKNDKKKPKEELMVQANNKNQPDNLSKQTSDSFDEPTFTQEKNNQSIASSLEVEKENKPLLKEPTPSSITKEVASGKTVPIKMTGDALLPKISTPVNQGPSLSHATSLALNNLPDISAALRRLSSAGMPASVIEQISSTNVLQTNEKKTTTEATPSEILGNALAAVAASTRVGCANSQQPPLSSGLSDVNNDNSISNGNTATAIGSLAAITANISNILTSSGFNRGSFSQEDTQKLAAAVAGVTSNNASNNNSTSNNSNNNTLSRRHSSITAVGNAFSNMIDQAIMIRRNKSISAPSQTPPQPKLVIKNEQVWKYMDGIEEKFYGYHLYSPQKLLPNLEQCLNGIVEIRIPAKYLTYENMQVKKRAVWGTDIYTDDSDVVAMIIHSGKYEAMYKEPEIEDGDPFALAVAGKAKEAMEVSKKLALTGKKWIRKDTTIPEYDLKVSLRILPKLQSYTGCIRNCIKSRDWKKHDGMSLFVNKIEKIKKGDARLKGRSGLKENMFVYENHRKKAMEIEKKDKVKEMGIQRGRIKKTPRVMRMFKVKG